MPFINWNSSYSVKNSDIDIQHQKLISIINELFDAMKVGRANEVINKVFDELVNYTIEHFSYEEKLMLMHSYPEYNQHKEEHQKLTNSVKELKQKVANKSLTISIETMNFLKEWLTNHILKTDMKLGEYLHSIRSR